MLYQWFLVWLRYGLGIILQWFIVFILWISCASTILFFSYNYALLACLAFPPYTGIMYTMMYFDILLQIILSSGRNILCRMASVRTTRLNSSYAYYFSENEVFDLYTSSSPMSVLYNVSNRFMSTSQLLIWTKCNKWTPTIPTHFWCNGIMSQLHWQD